jgi:hypothetical protein
MTIEVTFFGDVLGTVTYDENTNRHTFTGDDINSLANLVASFQRERKIENKADVLPRMVQFLRGAVRASKVEEENVPNIEEDKPA